MWGECVFGKASCFRCIGVHWMGDVESEFKEFSALRYCVICRSVSRCCWWSWIWFLMRLHVRTRMCSSSVVLSLYVLGMGLVKAFCTLWYVIVITGTLGDEGISNSIYGGGIGGGFGTLRDVCEFLSSVICVTNSCCSVGIVLWAAVSWRLIKVLAVMDSHFRSLMDVSTFPFDMPFVYCSRFRMDLITW